METHRRRLRAGGVRPVAAPRGRHPGQPAKRAPRALKLVNVVRDERHHRGGARRCAPPSWRPTPSLQSPITGRSRSSSVARSRAGARKIADTFRTEPYGGAVPGRGRHAHHRRTVPRSTRWHAPKGDGTRPTTDRVRESLMSARVRARAAASRAPWCSTRSPGRARSAWRRCRAARRRALLLRSAARPRALAPRSWRRKRADVWACEPARATVHARRRARARRPQCAPPALRPGASSIRPMRYDAIAVLGMAAALGASAALAAADAIVVYEHRLPAAKRPPRTPPRAACGFDPCIAQASTAILSWIC